MKRKGTTKKNRGGLTKKTYQPPVSLYPLSFEVAVSGLLQVKPKKAKKK